MQFRFLLILFLLSEALTSPLSGQTYLMDGSPITDCTGTFYDSGGNFGNYGNNQNVSTTICSNGAGGTHVRLSFTGTTIAAGDLLCFYDGPNLSAPLLACHTDYNPGSPFMIQATSANTSGCITVSFVSNLVSNGAGWSAAISCVPSCQTIIAEMASTIPAAEPADTGWIDVCPGERIFFNGKGLYPQNNLQYPQSDQMTTFEWNFGDGGIAQGATTSHRFANPGGYYVQLLLTDQYGCHSTNLVKQRVRVAGRPGFQVSGGLSPIICAGDTINLGASTSGAGSHDLLVTPHNGSFSQAGIRSDSLALPDGTGIPYETTILFTGFSPGQTLVNANDLESICVNIEHSWMRDMEITLTCPNGQSIILHDHPGNFGNEVYLGEPNDNDNVIPIPGVGYDYCWTNNAPNPTWIEYADANFGITGTLPSGEYSTVDPISDLLGCPLNGNWTLGVTDWWPLDNGFIFNWSLSFADHLFPTLETFSPALLSWEWANDASIFYYSTDSISASPLNPGNAYYIFTVHDDFGCNWDTLVSFQVLPPTHPFCFSCDPDVPVLRDTTICVGGAVQLDASQFAPANSDQKFSSNPNYPLGFANHPPSAPYLDDIAVSSLGYNTITNALQQVRSVCIDIETDFCADLNIFLRAPSGQLLELSSGNGGAGDNYKVTCFSPTASSSIIGQAAPFNGTFRPEGSWNTLNGASVNGDWSLRVSDAANSNLYGKVKSWSIEFDVSNTITYAWTNTGSLSCSTCPNPTATPSQSSTYAVSTTDAFGCQHHDTLTVNVTAFFPAPTGLAVINIAPGTLVWGWDPVPGALGYEVSINGGAWIAANGTLQHSVTGLTLGQDVAIQVRAISPSCPALPAQANTDFGNCNVSASLDSSTPAACANDSTGSALVLATGGNLPLTYLVDNGAFTYTTGNLQNMLPVGSHSVIVLDALGCTDTVSFSITGPAPIVLNTVVDGIDCFGQTSGGFTATAAGGTGSLSLGWQICASGVLQPGGSATGLLAGCYEVVATDINGCQEIAQIQLSEPLDFIVVTTQTPVACFGGNSGIATVAVTGATAPYDYLWDNSQMTATATGFTAGFHTVTVTDANSCQTTATVEITQPQQLVVTNTASQSVSCFGGNNGAASVSVNGGVTPYSYLWDGGQTSQTAQNITAGPHTVTVTDANGCITQVVVTVPEPFELVGTFTNIVNEPCVGNCQGQATIQPSGGTSPYSYSWNDPNITPGVLTATGLCAGSYTVTIQDAHGCTMSETVTIQPAVPIQVQFGPTPPSCVGLSNGSINAAVNGGTAPYQYFWENGNTTTTLQNVPCGEHFLTVTDGLGCVSNTSFVLDCPVAVSSNIVNIQAALCAGQANGSATVSPQGGNPPYTFSWSDPGAQTGAQANNLPAGVYTVTVSDANGCSITVSATISEPAPLSAQMSAVNLVCRNTPTGSATASPAGGTAPYSYGWSAGGNTAQISGLLAGTYTVTITDAHLCTLISTVTVTQPAQGVQVVATQAQAACFGEANGQASAAANGSTGPYSYLWNNGLQTPSVTGLFAGTYTVSATDQMGCVASQTVVVQELEKVTVNVAFVPPTCFGSNNAMAAVNLISGGIGMGDTSLYHYQWSIPNNQDAAVLTGLQGDKLYSITVTDFQGCSGTFSFFINQPPAIVLDEAIENVKCFGGSDGAVNIATALNSTPPLNYSWSQAQTSPGITNLPAGTYTVTVIDAKGCRATESFQVTQPEVLQLSFDQIALKCATDSNAVVTAYVKGGTVDYNYQWSNGMTTSEIDQLGPATYGLTITDANGCTIEGDQTIVQPDSLKIALQLIEPECFGEYSGRIIMQVSGGRSPYRYSLNDGEFGGSATFIGLTAGAYTLRVRDANGCLTTAEDTLKQPPAIVIDLPADTTLVYGDSLLLSASISNAFGATSYQWSSSFVDSFVCVDAVFCEEILVKPEYSNYYRLKVTDEKGCSGSSTVQVKVHKPRGIYVPTAFSPNGDLTNDLLVVHGLSKQVDHIVVFRVFDRWGELVHQDQDFPVNELSRGWDGSFKGQLCDPGVFVWYLEAEYKDGFREILKGEVTLIR